MWGRAIISMSACAMPSPPAKSPARACWSPSTPWAPPADIATPPPASPPTSSAGKPASPTASSTAPTRLGKPCATTSNTAPTSSRPAPPAAFSPSPTTSIPRNSPRPNSTPSSVVQVRTHLMKRKVGKEVCCLVAQLWNGGVARHERLAVAEYTACCLENAVAICDRLLPSRLTFRRLRRRKQAHEVGKFLDVTQQIVRSDFGGIRKIVGGRQELTSRHLLALGLKQFVGDAHLHVVRLGRKQQQGFVLGFPPKACDGAVVAIPVRLTLRSDLFCPCVAGNYHIHPAAHMHPPLLSLIRRLIEVVYDHPVWYLLDQARSKYRRWNSKDHVLPGQFRFEVRLLQHTAFGTQI